MRAQYLPKERAAPGREARLRTGASSLRLWGRDNLTQPLILSKLGELLILVDVSDIVIAAFFGPLQAAQAFIHVAKLRVDLRHHVVVSRPFFGRIDLRGDPGIAGAAERLRIQLQRP